MRGNFELKLIADTTGHVTAVYSPVFIHFRFYLESSRPLSRQLETSTLPLHPTSLHPPLHPPPTSWWPLGTVEEERRHWKTSNAIPQIPYLITFLAVAQEILCELHLLTEGDRFLCFTLDLLSIFSNFFVLYRWGSQSSGRLSNFPGYHRSLKLVKLGGLPKQWPCFSFLLCGEAELAMFVLSVLWWVCLFLRQCLAWDPKLSSNLRSSCLSLLSTPSPSLLTRYFYL